MAITPTVTEEDGWTIVTWEGLSQAEAEGEGHCVSADDGRYRSSGQAIGTFSGATVWLEASNDGVTFASTASENSWTEASLRTTRLPAARCFRPRLTDADGSTDLDFVFIIAAV